MSEPSPEDLSRRHLLIAAAAAAPMLDAATGADICFLGACEIVRLIRARKLSAREVLAAHLAQIERVNPKVNAIVTLTAEAALEDAKRADASPSRGALHGLPIAHKDLIDTKGVRTTYGSPLFKDHVPTEDDSIVERCRRAGAIMLGKTNTPEFGAGSQTFNTVFGATRNPYDVTKTCGGSSGGAAVALACGMIPIATGTDTGGSLRNPAAFTNVVGFRASTGRVPNPKALLAWSTLNTAGPMARSVADLALLLSAIAGPDPRAPLSLPESGDTFARALDRNFKGAKVAWFRNLGGVAFDPRVTEVVNAQRKIFESLGCIVEEAEPDFAGAEFAFRTLRAWNSAATHGDRVRANPSSYKETLRHEVQDGLRLTGPDLIRAQTEHAKVWRSFQTFLHRYEYFVLPVTQVPPFDITQEYPVRINGTQMETYIDWMKSCWYISIVGNPAISVPAGFASGLPIGLQIVGRDRADFSVLQLAHAFESATGFARTRPSVV